MEEMQEQPKPKKKGDIKIWQWILFIIIFAVVGLYLVSEFAFIFQEIRWSSSS